MFHHFLWFLIHYIYLCIYSFLVVVMGPYFCYEPLLFEIEKMDGEIDGNKISSIVYKIRNNLSPDISISNRNGNRKLIVFLSGAFNLELHPYIVKTIHDIMHHIPEIRDMYEMVCFENQNVSSILMYDEVARYIKNWYHAGVDDADVGREIVLVGYSAGGVVASHIMSRIQHLQATFKLVTYDTPWQIKDNVNAFSQYLVYRMDAIFFLKVYMTYLSHYNYSEISKYLDDTRIGYGWNGATEMFQLIQYIHQYDDNVFYEKTGFCFDLGENVRVVNLYNACDPLVIRDSHDVFYEKNKVNIKFDNSFLRKNIVGHCSDMAFSLEYLDTFVPAILR